MANIKTKDPNLVELSQEMIKAGIIEITVPDACWLDGSRCPYGHPEGTFEKRPRHVCFVGREQGHGCPKLAEHKEDLKQFYEILISKEAKLKLQEVFDKFGRILSSEITRLVEDEDYETSNLEKIILNIAANILEREERRGNKTLIENKIIRIVDL